MTDQEDVPKNGDENGKESPERMKERCGDSNDWWKDRSLAEKVLIGIGFAILGAGFLTLVILVTKALWNWLMPEIFNLPVIGYWQTAGLLALSCVFFNGFGNSSKGGGKRGDRRRRRHLKRYMEKDACCTCACHEKDACCTCTCHSGDAQA